MRRRKRRGKREQRVGVGCCIIQNVGNTAAW
jgi:hypothetical protein